jgi:hypothetical protein
VIPDFSIQLGDQKCLIIAGVPVSRVQMGKALTFADIEPLEISIHKSTSAQVVALALERVREKVGSICQICADEGSDIAAGIRIYQKQHPDTVYNPDLIHKIANILKAALESDEGWIAFKSKATETASALRQTSLGHLAPPNQRSKSRFLNIDVLVDWAEKALVLLDDSTHLEREEIVKHLGWLRDMKREVDYYVGLVRIVRIARNKVREEGLRVETSAELEVQYLFCKEDPRCYQVVGLILDFLVAREQNIKPGEVHLGSSEVIESLFGKLKTLEGERVKGGFTSLVLAAAACMGELDIATVETALESVKGDDVKNWASEQIGKSYWTKRRKDLSPKRCNKKLNMNSDLHGSPEELVVNF